MDEEMIREGLRIGALRRTPDGGIEVTDEGAAALGVTAGRRWAAGPGQQYVLKDSARTIREPGRRSATSRPVGPTPGGSSASTARAGGAFSDLRPRRRLPRRFKLGALAVVVALAALATAYVVSTRVDATAINGTENAQLVAITPNGRYIYSVGFYSTSVVDTATNQVIARLPVGNGSDISVSPDGRNVYVTSKTSGSVVIIDTAVNQVMATIPLAGESEEIAVSPDGTRAYVTFQSDTATAHESSLAVIDTLTKKVVTVIPGFGGYTSSVAVSPNGDRAYVSSMSDGQSVSVIDTNTLTVAAQHEIEPVFGRSFGPLTVAGNHVYDTEVGGASLRPLDLNGQVAGADLTIPGETNTVAASPPGGDQLFVAYTDPDEEGDPGVGRVSIVDTQSHNVVRNLKLDGYTPRNPAGIVVTPDRRRMYVVARTKLVSVEL